MIGTIARHLARGVSRRMQNRALGAIGLGGWKLHLFRAVQAALRQRRQGPQPPPRRNPR